MFKNMWLILLLILICGISCLTKKSDVKKEEVIQKTLINKSDLTGDKKGNMSDNKNDSSTEQTIEKKKPEIFIQATLKAINPKNENQLGKQVFEINYDEILSRSSHKWDFQIIDSKDITIYSIQNESVIPETYEWIGITADDKLPFDGEYKAKIAVYYDNQVLNAESNSFQIDTSPPEISLKMTPEYFCVEEHDLYENISFDMNIRDSSEIVKWKLIVSDGNNEFMAFTGDSLPKNPILWNGQNLNGQYIINFQNYGIKIQASDQNGNFIEKEFDPIKMNVLLIKQSDGKYKINSGGLYFKGNSCEIIQTKENKQALDNIVNILTNFKNYKIVVEGHASKYHDNLNLKAAKYLSENRAKTVIKMLNKLGISLSKMDAIGKGFDVPVINYNEKLSFQDYSKNRRVEFYLMKVNN